MYYFLILLTSLSMVSCNSKPKSPEASELVVQRAPMPAFRAEMPAVASGNNPALPDVPANGSFEMPYHSAWNSLLQRFVDAQGNVDYKTFAGSIAELDRYLENLAGNEPPESAMKNERLAYYINLYNAATVKLILDNYPVKSIKDIKSPWDKKWIKIGDRQVSLGNIEHKILRKMGEPRIHFAINCASFSCPKLLNRAFTASQMEQQLQETALGFIRDPSKNKISESSLQLSNIFNWYKMDFTEDGTLIEYLDKFTEEPISSDATIKYLDYNWSLNEAK